MIFSEGCAFDGLFWGARRAGGVFFFFWALFIPFIFFKFLTFPFDAGAGHFFYPLYVFENSQFPFDALRPRGGPYFSAPAEK